MNWQVAAELMSGFGTMGALIFVAFQTLHSNRALRQARELMELERERDQRAELYSAKKTAEGVGSWPAVVRREDGTREWGLEIINPSTAPVYEFTVNRAAGQADNGRTIDVIRASAAVLAPGRYFASSGRFLEWLKPDAETEPIMGGRRYRAALTFTDTNGRRWKRDIEGRLTEVTDTPNLVSEPAADQLTARPAS